MDTRTSRRLISAMVAFTIALLIGACAASRPASIKNACTILDTSDGWFGDWRDDVEAASREYNIAPEIILATVHQESKFVDDAKPPRRWILGIIPWTRPSSAYGYPQALDGTWSDYQQHTGRWGAERDDFSDSAYFVAWYHDQSARKNGIRRDDAYSLYLNYHEGHGGYRRGSWANKNWLKKVALKVDRQADQYRGQLRACG
ncbi:hypothetical protein OAS86_07090 [Gammaproteobacteria bacterium]|nr:hypothetical protein [Gammaproteobacteria bacterium]